MLSMRHIRSRLAREGGAVTVLFALLLTIFLVLGSLVISVGSWYTHARQLQTKVDAAALAGGGAWSFPCNPNADARIADTARLFYGEHTKADGTAYAGNYNQQIGGVEGNKQHVRLNQANWWDDSPPSIDFTSPAGSVCSALSLEVKATEDDSPLLWGWLPFTPDIKKRAKVELRNPSGLKDLLPIGVRVPKPVSSAAVFFNEADGSILGVRYFDENQSISGLPSGYEGFTTRSQPIFSVTSLPKTTGVAIALGFAPRCISTDNPSPCFEDEGFTTVNQLCNQGGVAQVVQCYGGSGVWPTRNVTTGLHFLHGWSSTSVANGPPELRGAFLSNAGCESNGYFNAPFVGSCGAQLTVDVDLGSLPTRIADNVRVRYKVAGGSFCNNCVLTPSAPNATGVVRYQTTGSGSSLHVPLTARSGPNPIAIEVSVRNSPVAGNANCPVANYSQQCQWFHLGSGIFGTSAPSDTQILNSPVQRAFMGDLDLSGPLKWLRVNKDLNCDLDTFDAGEASDQEAASQGPGGACFWMDMGLKGVIARDQDEPPFGFVEGSGSSQLGVLDCDPQYNQGSQGLIDAVVGGCAPFYVANKFNSNPLCPDQNSIFNNPLPPPFDDWPPLDCVKTRPTSQASQIITGLNQRIFGVANNPSCPSDNAGQYVRGRNYWHRENNAYDAINFAWDNDNASPLDNLANRLNPADPRLVTLFFTPYDSFSGSGQNVFPVVGLGQFYITGYGKLNGSGNWQGDIEDPCSDGSSSAVYAYAGNDPPPDLNSAGGNGGGTVIWGHFIKGVVQSGATTGGEGACVETALGVCVPVLTE
jgi:hypothetical protein